MVRLKIDNQKNGKQGQIMAQQALPIPCCPVKACVARVLDLLAANATQDTLICTYRPSPSAPFLHITSDDITQAICTAIPHLADCLLGYCCTSVGSHSLQAGGTMALFLSGATPKTIMKMGRWTSTTFMTYIHEQVDLLSHNVLARMSNDVTFANLDTMPPLP